MANTTTGVPLPVDLPASPAHPPGFFQGAPTKLLNAGVNPFNQYVWPLPPEPPKQDFSFYAARFLGLPTTNTQPFQQQQWEYPVLPREAYPTGTGRAAFTNNLLGIPYLTLAVQALIGNATVPSEGLMGNTTIAITGGLV